MLRISLRFLVFVVTAAFIALIPPLSAQTAPEVQQVAPAPGTYVIPQGWREERSDGHVILSVPNDKVLIYLWIFRNDKRESWRAAGEFASNQVGQSKDMKWTVVDRNIYNYGDKEVARITLTQESKGRPKRHEFILAIPIDGGNLFMLVNAIESSLGEYENAINGVMDPLLPKSPKDPTPYPVSSTNVGLKLMVAPDWHTEPESRGERSGVYYLKITNGNALLSLSSHEDPRSSKEYVAEVEKNMREQSKSYEKQGETVESVAGIPGTRLEVRTIGTDSKVPVKRWVFVFSRNNRHYVVAAAAPEGGFEKLTNDFKQMIASIALAQ